ncbi:MAG: DUF885 domain-containing protein, partial [Pseudomonadota bacterium]|nr:DUF885 domain-containing protein [Pseudomonadota bacterium]
MRRSLVFAFALALAAPVYAQTPAQDFNELLADHYAWLLRESPISATALGVRDHDDSIGDYSAGASERRTREAQVFLDRLNRIAPSSLNAADRTTHAILKRMLAEQIEGQRYGQRKMLFTTYSGWHQSFADMAGNLPFRTKADYRSYVTRLGKYPALNDWALKTTTEALEAGYVLPCSVLGGYENTIAGVITPDVRQSRFYEPFTRARPADASAAEWEAMQAEARIVITEVVNPAYAKHRDFYAMSYAPKCAKADGISAQKGGRDYYTYRVRQETTTALSPDRIHQIGLDEAARIRTAMEAVATEAGFASREAYIAHLRSDPRYFATTAEELMEATARMTKRIDGRMPEFFGTLPRLPYGIRAIPAETAETTTTAYYNQGSPQSGIAGTYYVNTSKLNQRPLWEIPALTLHEGVPGHHHQIALQQEIDLAPFRRNFAFFTAFTEGWGLYAESIGTEMGIYD